LKEHGFLTPGQVWRLAVTRSAAKTLGAIFQPERLAVNVVAAIEVSLPPCPSYLSLTRPARWPSPSG
jgi:hypothetical protein